VRAPNAPTLPATGSRFGVLPVRVVPPPKPPQDPPKETRAPDPPVKEARPVELEPPAAPTPAPKRKRAKKKKPHKRRQDTVLGRSFCFPLSLIARLDRFGAAQAERTDQRFNYSVYMTAILDADLTKRGF